MGAIGRSWEIRWRFPFDLSKEWGAASLTPETWAGIDVDKKLGLRLDQAMRLHEKYDRVLVIPIWRPEHGYPDPEYIGCVVIDTPRGLPSIELDTPTIVSMAGAAAGQIGIKVDHGG